jgi:small subunit ribosomal protein S15
MARMYSRRRGKSGSKKPLEKAKQSWLRYKPKEVEMLIVKLAKEGKSASQIGLALRDSYGVPDVRLLSGKSITKIMEEKKLAPKIPEDLMALIKKSIQIRKHREENKQDMTSLRGLQLTESKIKRLVKYYKKTKKLPVDWKYDVKSVKLYAE